MPWSRPSITCTPKNGPKKGLPFPLPFSIFFPFPFPSLLPSCFAAVSLLPSAAALALALVSASFSFFERAGSFCLSLHVFRWEAAQTKGLEIVIGKSLVEAYLPPVPPSLHPPPIFFLANNDDALTGRKRHLRLAVLVHLCSEQPGRGASTISLPNGRRRWTSRSLRGEACSCPRCSQKRQKCKQSRPSSSP